MTHEIDIQRVRGELKWDSFPGERAAAKVVCIREESDRLVANLLPQAASKPWSREDVKTIAEWIGFALVIFALAVGARVL